MERECDYRLGDRVRLTCPYAGGSVGEEAQVIHVKRNDRGDVLSLDILFVEQAERTRGTTVYPREVEPVPVRPAKPEA
jgi:hypothetical protein